jgi:hypothetical protein
MVLVLAIVALTIWRGDVSYGTPYSFVQIILLLALAGALIQTRFLFRNMRVTFNPPDTDRLVKPKRYPKHDLLDLVNTLDEQERTELYGLLDDQADDRFRQ